MILDAHTRDVRLLSHGLLLDRVFPHSELYPSLRRESERFHTAKPCPRWGFHSVALEVTVGCLHASCRGSKSWMGRLWGWWQSWPAFKGPCGSLFTSSRPRLQPPSVDSGRDTTDSSCQEEQAQHHPPSLSPSALTLVPHKPVRIANQTSDSRIVNACVARPLFPSRHTVQVQIPRNMPLRLACLVSL